MKIRTEDGISLDAELHVPEGATTCVVLAHPHPDYGGSMHVPVIDTLFRALPTAALRFDFRGVDGAALDLRAAIDAVPPELAVVVCGYSFGADVSLSVDHPRIERWIAVCPPLALVPPDAMTAASDARPKHLLVAEHDQYDPPEVASSRIEGWTNTTLEVVPGTDHFLGGAMTAVADAVRSRL